MASLPEEAIINKESVSLLLDCYNTPNTIPLAFSFEPLPIFDRSFTMQNHSIDGRSLYALNGYFTEKEGKELRAFSKEASFSQKIFGNHESEQSGEIPAKMMNGKERWQFFERPPSAIHSLFRLFGYLSNKMDVKITTLPWCLSDQKTTSTCLATNFLNENSKMSETHGKHQDYNPENGLAFTIPCLYGSEENIYHSHFSNGGVGKPLIMTVMVYATADNFLPEYGMGTFFYHHDGKEIKIDCRHMQMVFFEGDIWHAIEESRIPEGIKTWRVSYVFKIIFNPKRSDQDLRQSLFHEIKNLEIST